MTSESAVINNSQYDDIGEKYAAMKSLPWNEFEVETLHAVVQPIIDRNLETVALDLACGTGFYTRLLLDWGATRAIGVDISPIMIDVANKEAGEIDDQKLAFQVGDARSLGLLKGQGAEGGFDIVLGTWMLNYAKDEMELEQMWRTIASNLKVGGTFVGIVPHMSDDLDALVQKKREFNRAFPGYFGVTWEYPVKLKNGNGYQGRVQVHGRNEFGFDFFHLRADLYISTAKSAGMLGAIEINHFEVSDEQAKNILQDYLDKYKSFGTHFSILKIGK